MKAIRLSWTDFNKHTHADGLLTGNKMVIDLQDMSGRLNLDIWDSDTEYLDPEITGQSAAPRAALTKDVLSTATKQAFVAAFDSMWADLASGKLPLQELSGPTEIDPSTGTVINQPTS